MVSVLYLKASYKQRTAGSMGLSHQTPAEEIDGTIIQAVDLSYSQYT